MKLIINYGQLAGVFNGDKNIAWLSFQGHVNDGGTTCKVKSDCSWSDTKVTEKQTDRLNEWMPCTLILVIKVMKALELLGLKIYTADQYNKIDTFAWSASIEGTRLKLMEFFMILSDSCFAPFPSTLSVIK